MCTQAKITLTAGDRLPELVCSESPATDLTGYTITLHLRRPDDSVVIRPAVPIDLAASQYKFDWGAGDLVEGLGQLAEIQRVTPGGLPQTSEKFAIDVVEEIA